MRKYPKTRRSQARYSGESEDAGRKGRVSRGGKMRFGEMPEDAGGFMTLLLERIGRTELDALDQRTHPAGRPAHVLGRGQLLAALIFHYTVTWAGSFGEHLFCLMGIRMAESTLSQRRRAVPFDVFVELLSRLLRPITNRAQEFYRGLRLVAIDGVNFSLPNTEDIEKNCRKGGNQHGRVSFAKLQCAVLLEVAFHNPLAAGIGRSGESEWKLAQGLLDSLPENALLLGDRLYGRAAFAASFFKKFQGRGSHFLLRVKEATKARPVTRLKDGSQIVEVRALEPDDTHRIAATVQVREIRAAITRRGFRTVRMRLWTSLRDPAEARAAELVSLYAARWEQELYFRELKRELHINDLLRSQTLETAAQEVAAMIIGSSLIAHERAKLKSGEVPQHRLSLIKVWETLEPLWLTLLLGADLLTEKQKQTLSERFYSLASKRCMAKKRCRSCPRVMRQPDQQFPRKKNEQGSTAPLKIKIVSRFG